MHPFAVLEPESLYRNLRGQKAFSPGGFLQVGPRVSLWPCSVSACPRAPRASPASFHPGGWLSLSVMAASGGFNCSLFLLGSNPKKRHSLAILKHVQGLINSVNI